MKKYWLLFFLSFYVSVSDAQTKITSFFSQLLTNDKDTVALIKNSEEIVLGESNPMFDEGIDFFLRNSLSGIKIKDNRIVIDKHIVILGIPKDRLIYWFRGFHFTKSVRINIPPKEFDGIISIDDCIFENGFSFDGDFSNAIIQNSIFKEYFSINSETARTLLIDSSSFNFNGKIENVLFLPSGYFERPTDNWFYTIPDGYKYDTLNKYNQQIVKQDIDISIKNINRIAITRNSFFTSKQYYSIFNISTQCKDFSMTKNNSNQVLNLNDLKVSNSLVFSENRNEGLISISNLELPDFSNKINISWDQFSGRRISVFEIAQDKYGGLSQKTDAIYRASVPTELKNNIAFTELTRSYQMLLNVFKTNGDLESVNGCFSEMKDIQGSRLKNDYISNGGFRQYFRWKINWLMKIYTNHGTDPALAIVVSFYVIIFFAIIFCFFPSDWDITSKSKLLADFRILIQRNEKGYMKPFFNLAIGFCLSLLNAVTLSINSFTTLGFGNIPTHGIARYLCIIEGFVGWFLLSIFTVALINQVSI